MRVSNKRLAPVSAALQSAGMPSNRYARRGGRFAEIQRQARIVGTSVYGGQFI